jgi:hypothetical protein
LSIRFVDAPIESAPGVLTATKPILTDLSPYSVPRFFHSTEHAPRTPYHYRETTAVVDDEPDQADIKSAELAKDRSHEARHIGSVATYSRHTAKYGPRKAALYTKRMSSNGTPQAV